MSTIEKEIINLDKELSDRRASLYKEAESIKEDGNIYYNKVVMEKKVLFERHKKEKLKELDYNIDQIDQESKAKFAKLESDFFKNFSPVKIAQQIAVEIEADICNYK